MDSIAARFPALSRTVYGKRLAYLDSAASAQKPHVVLDALMEALGGPYANIHRGLYYNSAETTAAFEAARERMARFMNADPRGLIVVRNATEGVNLVAQAWGRTNLTAKDAIVLSEVEHHANIVPWQLLQREIGFEIRVIPLDVLKASTPENIKPYVDGAKLLAITQMSNVSGLKPDLGMMIPLAKAAGCVVLVDGSQGVVHARQDLSTLGADFYVMTGHKLYGPNGIGMLWGNPDMLETMPPYQGGGDMIDKVVLPLGTTYAGVPARFEAGTPAISELIALAAAADFMDELGWDAIGAREHSLAVRLSAMMAGLDFVEVYSSPDTGIVAFNVKGAHPADVATLLDQQGVAVRSGHHCAMPYMAALGIESCLRASLGIYTTEEDIAQLEEALTKARQMLV
ncbi:MAG: aminotransferase class V-fold PLP-dependent enzyme [Alphaproteobacteria bacterium]|nr:MAG: aminotransferase class V-fold PLP-dependent enzyme [Alphaproteobacteria bacterium]